VTGRKVFTPGRDKKPNAQERPGSYNQFMEWPALLHFFMEVLRLPNASAFARRGLFFVSTIKCG
jgi:hypothetical protein